MFTDFNGTQILLSIMIVLLGVTLVIVGVQLFFVLKDLRRSLARTDRILADLEVVSNKMITEQQHLDDILHSLHAFVTSLANTSSSVSSLTSKFANPMAMGMAFFRAFNAITGKHHKDQS
jgi:hypothetical protein